MGELIRFEDVTFTYAGGSQPSLKGVSAAFLEGEFVLISGPSGCGKSTLLRCMNGLVPHFYPGTLTGKVTVEGVNTVSADVSALSQRVGLVFSDPESQLVSSTVEKEVSFGPGNLGLPVSEVRARTEWALEKVGISHLRRSQPSQLSGGEQQKVAIASVLALKPAVIALDEPTANLDPASAKELISTLALLNSQGSTIILVEHRLEMLAPYVSRVLLMSSGRIVLDALPESAFSNPILDELGVEHPLYNAFLDTLHSMGVRARSADGMTSLIANLEKGEYQCDNLQ
ncbi:MAG: ABC transporter ATP-binding protein [Thermoprotei archaeon]